MTAEEDADPGRSAGAGLALVRALPLRDPGMRRRAALLRHRGWRRRSPPMRGAGARVAQSSAPAAHTSSGSARSLLLRVFCQTRASAAGGERPDRFHPFADAFTLLTRTIFPPNSSKCLQICWCWGNSAGWKLQRPGVHASPASTSHTPRGVSLRFPTLGSPSQASEHNYLHVPSSSKIQTTYQCRCQNQGWWKREIIRVVAPSCRDDRVGRGPRAPSSREPFALGRAPDTSAGGAGRPLPLLPEATPLPHMRTRKQNSARRGARRQTPATVLARAPSRDPINQLRVRHPPRYSRLPLPTPRFCYLSHSFLMFKFFTRPEFNFDGGRQQSTLIFFHMTTLFS